MRTLLRATTAYGAIRAEAMRGELPHATLVLFPDESNLRALLRECAKAVFNAADGSREERLIESECFADCIFLPAAGEKLTVKDGARVIDESLLRPLEGEKKLFVIDAFHAAPTLVQNKLLKVLEEPPTGVYFLLGASTESAVLPTVLSRVVCHAEPPFSEEAIFDALVRAGKSEGAREAAAACGGVYSLALELLEGGGEEFRLAEEFLSGERVEELCRALGEKKQKLAFFAAVRLLLRDMLFIATGRERYAAIKSDTVYNLAKKYPAGALLSAIGFVADAERDLKFNANPGQAAYTLALRIRKETEKWKRLS